MRVAILIEQQYQDLEVWYSYYRLKEAGHKVALIGAEKGKIYPGKFNIPAKAELSITEVGAEDFDAVIVPGGFAPDYMRRTEGFAELIKEMHGAGKLIAAICHGPWLLASANIIGGVRLTSFFAIKDDIKNAGGIYIDEEVVQDKNIITSRMPEDLPAFCITILKALGQQT